MHCASAFAALALLSEERALEPFDPHRALRSKIRLSMLSDRLHQDASASWIRSPW
jgi:hypothetical protein